MSYSAVLSCTCSVSSVCTVLSSPILLSSVLALVETLLAVRLSGLQKERVAERETHAIQETVEGLTHCSMTLHVLYAECFSLVQSGGGCFVVSLGLNNSAYVHPQSQHPLQLLGRVAGSRDYGKRGRECMRERRGLSRS